MLHDETMLHAKPIVLCVPISPDHAYLRGIGFQSKSMVAALARVRAIHGLATAATHIPNLSTEETVD